MSLAADTRAAVRAHPFLHDALRAGVLNHAAAAEWLLSHAVGLEGDADAIATAIRRFGTNLDDLDRSAVRASVSMRSGVAIVDRDRLADEDARPVATVGDVAVVPEGELTAVLATGSVGPGVLGHVLGRLRIAGIGVHACAAGGETCLLVVDRLAGADAVRVLEDALTAVPDREID
ncbi:DUF7523 family protein [Halopenitus persicus]|uniref:Aspartate kinase n=1 Tax=Halopenitus persicus TaxID=1048396 RepID=A0A1H3GWG9_9EURY|nr:hypothetical protein [Halopenitus persicus]QHS17424.1 hypothetical protein GWK26_09850 [haloarchaeon 3A1-DGR]SDY07642.1 hypothetical protein SAMN05216564_10324 [Halopenitus persicus]